MSHVSGSSSFPCCHHIYPLKLKQRHGPCNCRPTRPQELEIHWFTASCERCTSAFRESESPFVSIVACKPFVIDWLYLHVPTAERFTAVSKTPTQPRRCDNSRILFVDRANRPDEGATITQILWSARSLSCEFGSLG